MLHCNDAEGITTISHLEIQNHLEYMNSTYCIEQHTVDKHDIKDSVLESSLNKEKTVQFILATILNIQSCAVRFENKVISFLNKGQ